MKLQVFILCLGCATAAQVAVNPIQKVLQMISDLEVKVISEGEDTHKLYEEFAEMCEDRSKDLHFNIKTAKAEIVDLKATIEQKSAAIATLGSKIEELAGSIAENEAELKKATGLRKKEAADFAAAEKELLDTISTIERASGIIERELQGGSFAQLKGAAGLEQALATLLQASAISSADSGKLMALVQSASSDEADDAGAPAAAVYENQSGGILDALAGLLTKAEEQLDAARKEETTSKHNYELLRQSLEDEIKFATKDMNSAKKSLAENKEKKATAEGDLATTSKDLAADTKALADLHHDCMTKASDYEDETKSRGEELKALATAKKIIKEATGGADGAEKQTYGLVQEVSLLQVSNNLVAERAMRVVRRLASAQHSTALTQLVSRMLSAMRSSDNPFAKVEALISDMIAKLEKEAEEDATKKAWCDKEMAENAAKKEDKSSEVAKLNTKIAQKSAQSAKLKEEVATLQNELATLAKEQGEMDKMRQEENAAYSKNKPEMEKGLEGISLALKVLRDYYAKEDGDHDSAGGAASGIIGLLEVAESDFTKGIAEMTAEEESAAAAYEKETNDNEVSRATKEQDVKYKTKEAASLDNAVAELTADSSNVQAELDAVLEYGKELDKECVAKAETYESIVARRNAELAGLKEALEILSNDASLIQKHSVRRAFRGSELRAA